MAIVQIGRGTSINKMEFQGESTDLKPILKEENTGSSLYCIDNGDYFLWHIDRWVKQ